MQPTLILRNDKNHVHSVIYDYENGEKIYSECGLVIKDKINDSELEIEVYKNKYDTNTALPYTLALYDQGISTIISDSYKYNANETVNNKNHHKI